MVNTRTRPEAGLSVVEARKWDVCVSPLESTITTHPHYSFTVKDRRLTVSLACILKYLINTSTNTIINHGTGRTWTGRKVQQAY